MLLRFSGMECARCTSRAHCCCPMRCYVAAEFRRHACRLADPANDPGPHHGPAKRGVALADNFFVDPLPIGGNRQQRQKRRYRANGPVSMFHGPSQDR